MAVKLRLTRIGKKKQPQYRIVGAQPTERVAKLLQISGAIEQFEAAKASK